MLTKDLHLNMVNSKAFREYLEDAELNFASCVGKVYSLKLSFVPYNKYRVSLTEIGKDTIKQDFIYMNDAIEFYHELYLKRNTYQSLITEIKR